MRPTCGPRLRTIAVVALAGVVAAGCGGGGGGDDGASGGSGGGTGGTGQAGTESGAAAKVIVLNGEGNNLNAYEPDPPFRKQTVIHTVEDDPDGLDINGQICFFPDGSGRFIAGEDTGQPERPPGWGIFQLRGDRVGDLSAREVGRLVPTYQATTDGPENYGCGVLPDGRVVTTDVGDQVVGPPTGQLILWFPPFDSDEVSYCKLDVALPTAGGIQVVGDDLYVAAARPPGNGVFRYRGPFPTSADAAGGCGKTDGTGAPLADHVDKRPFIPADEHVLTPNAVISGPDGGFYVSSAFTGVLAQYDARGRFVRTLVSPAPGAKLGAKPLATGSPMGIGVDSATSTVYWADIGLGIDNGSVGPVDGSGTLRRTTFDADGKPRPAEVMDRGLDFPDGIGLYVPGG